jgi:hypothetical protein
VRRRTRVGSPARRLTSRGPVDGTRVEAELRRIELGDLELTRRGFHWINESTYDR